MHLRFGIEFKGEFFYSLWKKVIHSIVLIDYLNCRNILVNCKKIMKVYQQGYIQAVLPDSDAPHSS